MLPFIILSMTRFTNDSSILIQIESKFQFALILHIVTAAVVSKYVKFQGKGRGQLLPDIPGATF